MKITGLVLLRQAAAVVVVLVPEKGDHLLQRPAPILAPVFLVRRHCLSILVVFLFTDVQHYLCCWSLELRQRLAGKERTECVLTFDFVNRTLPTHEYFVSRASWRARGVSGDAVRGV